ncbi:hypothetical protein ABFV05_020190 [Capra hircus]
MTKVTGNPQSSREVMEQPTPDTQDKKMKTSCQLKSKGSVRVTRTTMKVNKHIQEKGKGRRIAHSHLTPVYLQAPFSPHSPPLSGMTHIYSHGFMGPPLLPR